MQTRLARATFYRLKAEETRVLAEAMNDSSARTTMLEIAATFDRLADKEEKKHGHPST